MGSCIAHPDEASKEAMGEDLKDHDLEAAKNPEIMLLGECVKSSASMAS